MMSYTCVSGTVWTGESVIMRYTCVTGTVWTGESVMISYTCVSGTVWTGESVMMSYTCVSGTVWTLPTDVSGGESLHLCDVDRCVSGYDGIHLCHADRCVSGDDEFVRRCQSGQVSENDMPTMASSGEQTEWSGVGGQTDGLNDGPLESDGPLENDGPLEKGQSGSGVGGQTDGPNDGALERLISHTKRFHLECLLYCRFFRLSDSHRSFSPPPAHSSRGAPIG